VSFRKPKLPTDSVREKPVVAPILASLGIALGRELIPELIGRATRGKGDTLERVAAGVTDVVLGATGLSRDTPPSEIVDTLRKDPEAYARVKEAAASVAIAEIEAEIRATETAARDRESARKTYAEASHATVNKLAYIAAGFAAIGVLSVVGLAVAGIEIDSTYATLLGGVIAASLNYLSQVMNFFFGSSEGSKVKTDLMSARKEG
jgi:hypothetical protein